MNTLNAIDVMRERMNPRLSIPMSMLKAAKDWKVGEEYEISLKVKQVRVEESYEGEDVEVTFDVLKAKACEEEEESEDSDRNLLEKIEKNTRGFATA